VTQDAFSSPTRNMRLLCFFFPVFFLAWAELAPAQSNPELPYYGRKNTFGVLAAYSNDSSHILMGTAENRKLLNFGANYSRRLFQNRVVNWQYHAEILPVALESDPVSLTSVSLVSPPQTSPIPPETSIPVSACHSQSGTYTLTFQGVVYDYEYSETCSRRWTIGEGISPIGFDWNFLPRRKVQPFLLAHGGNMYSTQPIPTTGAGSFNFTFDFGVGIELFRSESKSVRADYRFHHISDHNMSTVNPGIDNGLFTLTYAFGR